MKLYSALRGLAVAAFFTVLAGSAFAQNCGGGANGTPQTRSYLLSNEFPDSAGTGAITPACMRDFLATSGWQINAQTVSYTLVLADVGKLVTMNVSGDATLTVPTNASVAFPIGSQVRVKNIGATANTNRLTIATGAVGTPQIDTGGSWTMTNPSQDWLLTKIATDEWMLSGNQPRMVQSDYSLITTDGSGGANSGAGVTQYWGFAGGIGGDPFACGASTFNDARITWSATGGPVNGPYRTLNVVAGDNYGGFGLRCQMGALELRWGERVAPYTVFSGSYIYTVGTFAIFREGDHRITEFDIRLPSNWPISSIPANGFQLVAQWKQCQPNTSVATSPTIELDQYNSQWIILSDPGSGSVSKYTSSNVSLSTWYHIKLDAWFSQYSNVGWIQLSTQALGSTPQLSGLIAMQTLQVESGAGDPQQKGASVPACLLVGPYARATMPTTSLDMTNFQVWDAN